MTAPRLPRALHFLAGRRGRRPGGDWSAIWPDVAIGAPSEPGSSRAGTPGCPCGCWENLKVIDRA